MNKREFNREVINQGRVFGSAQRYIHITLMLDGKPEDGLLTNYEALRAIQRGKDNPEDMPVVSRLEILVESVARLWRGR